jgi:hypothetical protein
MTATLISERPNCEDILSNKFSWCLSLLELQNSKKFKMKEIVNSDDMFHLYFVKMKSESTSELKSLENNKI